jgi:DNA replication protein DnaC
MRVRRETRCCRRVGTGATVGPPASSTKFTLARADGTYIRLLGKLARLDVLVIVIGGRGRAPVQAPERRDLLEILEGRYGTRSTIITSQLPPTQWHDYLADATLADAICDRLLHNAHRIVLRGPSRRKEATLDDCLHRPASLRSEHDAPI